MNVWATQCLGIASFKFCAQHGVWDTDKCSTHVHVDAAAPSRHHLQVRMW